MYSKWKSGNLTPEKRFLIANLGWQNLLFRTIADQVKCTKPSCKCVWDLFHELGTYSDGLDDHQSLIDQKVRSY